MTGEIGKQKTSRNKNFNLGVSPSQKIEFFADKTFLKINELDSMYILV